MNAKQNRILHALIGELKLTPENKKDMVHSASNGRVTSSKELTNQEANLLIRSLQQMKNDQVLKMRNKIIHMLCLYAPEIMTTTEGIPNYKVIDNWCKKVPASKGKSLWKMGKDIMRPLVTQVEIIVNKSLKS